MKSKEKIKVLLTKAYLDAHDRGMRYVAQRLMEAGMEVVLTRYGAIPEIVTTALQEDVDVVGISCSTGGHLIVCSKVIELLRKHNAKGKLVILGGIIPDDDRAELQEIGVAKSFGPGSDPQHIIDYIRSHVAKAREQASSSAARQL